MWKEKSRKGKISADFSSFPNKYRKENISEEQEGPNKNSKRKGLFRFSKLLRPAFQKKYNFKGPLPDSCFSQKVSEPQSRRDRRVIFFYALIKDQIF